MKKIFLILISIFLLTGCNKKTYDNPIVTMKIKDYGTIKIELYPKYAPNTVANFVTLVKNGFYDNNLTDGMEKSLGFLKVIKLPVHEVAMMMSIALRFIPILLEETDKIMKAQIARGADFESGNLIKRAKAMVPLLVPLFISAFRRANDLAMAMEARCYRGGEGRTKMKPLIYKKKDAIGYTVLFAYFAVSIAVGKFLF